jgi:hypothetical protein
MIAINLYRGLVTNILIFCPTLLHAIYLRIATCFSVNRHLKSMYLSRRSDSEYAGIICKLLVMLNHSLAYWDHL